MRWNPCHIICLIGSIFFPDVIFGERMATWFNPYKLGVSVTGKKWILKESSTPDVLQTHRSFSFFHLDYWIVLQNNRRKWEPFYYLRTLLFHSLTKYYPQNSRSTVDIVEVVRRVVFIWSAGGIIWTKFIRHRIDEMLSARFLWLQRSACNQLWRFMLPMASIFPPFETYEIKF